MRRFDYVSYVTPDDPKQPRQRNVGKVRTDAKTYREVAAALVGDNELALASIPDRQLFRQVAKNRFEFGYATSEPHPCQVHVEMRQVAEGTVHPLTGEGFVTWAARQVKKHPRIGGRPNTIERELAAVLHQRQCNLLYEQDASDLREWLADILMDGRTGYAQMTREELLQEIDEDILQSADQECTVVEDVVE
jgi:hypothetical protein